MARSLRQKHRRDAGLCRVIRPYPSDRQKHSHAGLMGWTLLHDFGTDAIAELLQRTSTPTPIETFGELCQDSLARSGGTVLALWFYDLRCAGTMRLRIALSVLPVVLIAVWLNLTSGDSFNLPINAIWAIVTLIGCRHRRVARTRRRSVQRHATVDHLSLGVPPIGGILCAYHPRHRRGDRAAGNRADWPSPWSTSWLSFR